MKKLTWIAPLLLILPLPSTALAGMPYFTLSELARLRIETLSFFLVVFLAVSFGIQRIWNRLQRDFPRLPRLTYRQALIGILLWGLIFYLILTMISGARELLTPNAWEKPSATYRLTQHSTASAELDLARRGQLDRLRDALWAYAEKHEGRLPAHVFVAEIPPARWQSLHPSGATYNYLGEQTIGGHAPVAWEPEVYGPERWTLMADGEIQKISLEALEARLQEISR